MLHLGMSWLSGDWESPFKTKTFWQLRKSWDENITAPPEAAHFISGMLLLLEADTFLQPETLHDGSNVDYELLVPESGLT